MPHWFGRGSVFHIPLIEPDRRVYRIRLSDKTSRLHPRRAATKLCQAYEPEVLVAKLCYRFGPLTPSARSANLIAGDGTKNDFRGSPRLAHAGSTSFVKFSNLTESPTSRRDPRMNHFGKISGGWSLPHGERPLAAGGAEGIRVR